MQTTSIDTVARTMAISSISAYQAYISPRKGFSCAHRLLHGEASCSDYVKHLLGEQTLTSAVQMSLQRFKACSAASYTLKVTKADGGCMIVPCCIPL